MSYSDISNTVSPNAKKSSSDVEGNTKEEIVSVPKTLEEAFQFILSAYPDNKYTVIEVTRKNIVKRTFECLEDECVEARVVAKFIGENAVDTGGVMREYFSELFLGFVGCASLVRGRFPNITFRHDIEHLQKGLFELFGKLVAVALVNGCPGPHFFCPLIAGYLLGVEQKPSLDAVPLECEFLDKMKKISECDDEESFSNAVSDFPERFDMGYTKAVVKFHDRIELLDACIKHVVISSVAEEIYSFRKGLSEFGVLESM